MTWLLALILRPVGAFALFGFALLVARVLWPLIPAGRVRTVLYDRTIRKKHPWAFFFLACFGVYGTIYTIYWFVMR